MTFSKVVNRDHELRSLIFGHLEKLWNTTQDGVVDMVGGSWDVNREVQKAIERCGRDPKKCMKDLLEISRQLNKQTWKFFDPIASCVKMGAEQCAKAKLQAMKDFFEGKGGAFSSLVWILDNNTIAKLYNNDISFKDVEEMYQWANDSCNDHPAAMVLKYKMSATAGALTFTQIMKRYSEGGFDDMDGETREFIANQIARGLVCLEDHKSACGNKKSYYFDPKGVRCNMKCPSDSQSRNSSGHCNCGGGDKCPDDYPFCSPAGHCYESEEAFKCLSQPGRWYSKRENACKMGCPTHGQGRNHAHACACGPPSSDRGFCPDEFPNCDATGHCVAASEKGVPMTALDILNRKEQRKQECDARTGWWWEAGKEWEDGKCNQGCPSQAQPRGSGNRCVCGSYGWTCTENFTCSDGLCVEKPAEKPAEKPSEACSGRCPDGWVLKRLEKDGTSVCTSEGSGNEGECDKVSSFSRGYDTKSWASGCATNWSNTVNLCVGQRAPGKGSTKSCTAKGRCPDNWLLTRVDADGTSHCNGRGSGNEGDCSLQSQFSSNYDVKNWASGCKTTWSDPSKTICVGERG